MTFPNGLFGKCPVCGGDASDDPYAGGADAPATDTSSTGFPLVMYQGKAMCQLCKKRLQADEESKLAGKRRAREEQFRARAGFTNRVT